MHSDGLTALLGPHSPVAEALAARRPDLADALIAPWREIFGDSLRVEIVSHRARSGTLSTPVAARLLGWARERGITPVLAHAVRYAEPRQGRIVDVLDATRRLVALDERHRDRPNAQGFLASTAFMSDLADEIAQAAGAGRRTSRDLLAAAFDLAGECALTPADLGIGEVIVPELDVVAPSSSSSSSSRVSSCGVILGEIRPATRHSARQGVPMCSCARAASPHSTAISAPSASPRATASKKSCARS